MPWRVGLLRTRGIFVAIAGMKMRFARKSQKSNLLPTRQLMGSSVSGRRGKQLSRVMEFFAADPGNRQVPATASAVAGVALGLNANKPLGRSSSDQRRCQPSASGLLGLLGSLSGPIARTGSPARLSESGLAEQCVEIFRRRRLRGHRVDPRRRQVCSAAPGGQTRSRESCDRGS